ncbi:uncharacterized protein LOC129042244 [Pongo pygmaeus]|uniref:uncharacterized protein LOC129042244 n=1 Tax=Pongo pygmaeus TaxID=9600 RepID=UPI0023E0B03F|nr:uncharacterized protein LOC129042244 [Pongo pygmaeus]
MVRAGLGEWAAIFSLTQGAWQDQQLEVMSSVENSGHWKRVAGRGNSQASGGDQPGVGSARVSCLSIMLGRRCCVRVTKHLIACQKFPPFCACQVFDQVRSLVLCERAHADRSGGALLLCLHAAEPQGSPAHQACGSAAKCVRCASWVLLCALSYGDTGSVGLDRYRSDYGGTGDVGLDRYWSDYSGTGSVQLDRYWSDYSGTGSVQLDRYQSDAWTPYTPAVASAVKTGRTHVIRGAQAGVLVLGQPSGSPDPGPTHTAAQEGRAESQVSPGGSPRSCPSLEVTGQE